MTGLSLNQLQFQRAGFSLDVNLHVALEGVLLIQGKNGSGKSTLLQLIVGLLTPNAGRLLWQGQEITAQPPGKRPFSVIFQQNNLFGHLTVAQNLALAFAPRWWLTKAQQQAQQRLCDHFGIASWLTMRADQLSGGQQQLVALLRSFLQQRPLMIWDEPFTGLDTMVKEKVMMYLKEYVTQQKTTLVLTIHNVDEKASLQQYFNGKVIYYKMST